MINDQGQGSQAQSREIGPINSAMSQLNINTQQNAALVEKSAAASKRLRRHDCILIDAASAFKPVGSVSSAR